MLLKFAWPMVACRIGENNVDRYLCLVSCHHVPAVVSLSVRTPGREPWSSSVSAPGVSWAGRLRPYVHLPIPRRALQQFGRLTCTKILVRVTPLVSLRLQSVDTSRCINGNAGIRRGFTRSHTRSHDWSVEARGRLAFQWARYIWSQQSETPHAP